jgi:multiple sugar transport system permease protein
MTRKTKRRLRKIARFTALGIWFFIVTFPIYWIFATSFKPDHEWFSWPPVYWSSTPTLDNYLNVWTSALGQSQNVEAMSMQKPWVALENSFTISMVATTISVFFGTLLAYGVSRYQILSNFRMFQLLMLRMIPPIVVAVPVSIYFTSIRLIDTISGLAIIYIITTLPYSVWMAKSFIDEVPREMEHAAEILGASRWQTIWEVVLPLIRSGLVATFMFILILTWSEYLMALILSKTDVVTLPILLSKYEGATEGRVYGRQAALAVGITIPLIFIGIFIRKHLVRGFSFGMVKR